MAMEKDASLKMTVKLRLRDKCAAELNRQASQVNVVWNYCNETAKKAWDRDRKWLSAFDLGRLTSGVSKELDLHAHTIQGVCKQFDRSRAAAKRAALRWRGRKALGWVPFNTGHVSFDGEYLSFRGIRYLPMHSSPHLSAGAKIGPGSFNQDSKGRWFINLSVEVPCEQRPAKAAVGVDLGLKTLATLSDGRKVDAGNFYRASERALAKSQRANKSKRARSIHMKVAARRRDALHKASSALAKEYGLIVIGDVSPSKMAQTRMAKSVSDAGWSSFKKMLSYKAMMHGGRCIEVNERLSTQTCSECGSLPASRPTGIAGLGIREWECDDCGAVHDRDVNAARNILRVGLDTLAEGAMA